MDQYCLVHNEKILISLYEISFKPAYEFFFNSFINFLI
jgi:hypothetical protein